MCGENVASVKAVGTHYLFCTCKKMGDKMECPNFSCDCCCCLYILHAIKAKPILILIQLSLRLQLLSLLAANFVYILLSDTTTELAKVTFRAIILSCVTPPLLKAHCCCHISSWNGTLEIQSRRLTLGGIRV